LSSAAGTTRALATEESLTTVSLTEVGRTAFIGYLDAMATLVNPTA
jgi:hypothetical protein